MSRRAGGTGWDLWILLRVKAEDLNLQKEKRLGKIKKEKKGEVTDISVLYWHHKCCPDIHPHT